MTVIYSLLQSVCVFSLFWQIIYAKKLKKRLQHNNMLMLSYLWNVHMHWIFISQQCCAAYFLMQKKVVLLCKVPQLAGKHFQFVLISKSSQYQYFQTQSFSTSKAFFNCFVLKPVHVVQMSIFHFATSQKSIPEKKYSIQTGEQIL